MKEATKDRLFELGIRVPRAVEIQDDQGAAEKWAEQAIAQAEASPEGAEAALAASAAVAASEEIATPLAQGDGDPGAEVGEPEPETLDAGDLAAMLGKIRDTATELLALLATDGPDAVYARLGELQEWTAAAADVETPEAGPVVEEPTGPAPAPAPAPAGEAEPHTPEKVAELAADLERREEADAEKRAAADVEVTGSEAEAAAVPFSQELEAINTRLVIAESEITDLAGELRGETRNTLLALADRLTRLEGRQGE